MRTGSVKWLCAVLTLLAKHAAAGSGHDSNEELQKLCDSGNAKSCASLAARVTDWPTTIRLYEKACDGGAWLGCNNLVNIYSQGRAGVPPDKAKALRCAQKACTIDAQQCYHLGALYRYGDGVAKDDAKAGELYWKCCDAGSPFCCQIAAGLQPRARSGPDVARPTAVQPAMASSKSQKAATVESELAQPANARTSTDSVNTSACTSLPKNSGLRFDGTYQTGWNWSSGPSGAWHIRYYLRFYADGTVLSEMGVDGTNKDARNVERWLNRTNSESERACVTITSAKLRFAFRSTTVTIEYSGQLKDNRLTLHYMSSFKEPKERKGADKIYDFVPFGGAPAEPITCKDVFAHGWVSKLEASARAFFSGRCNHYSQTARACLIAAKTMGDLMDCERKEQIAAGQSR